MALNRLEPNDSGYFFKPRANPVLWPLRQANRRLVPFDERVSLGPGFLINFK
jgi:hypothetical protein